MRRAAQAFGVVFLLLALGLLLAAVLTSNWIVITVNLSASTDQLALYSRNRGVYKECWTTNSLSTVIQENDYFLSGLCLRLDSRVLDIRSNIDYTQSYNSRAGLLIAFWVLVAVSGLLMLIALCLVIYSSCQDVDTYQWKHSCKAASALMLGTAFCNVLAMAFYHGAEHLELNTITDPSGEQAPYSMFFAKDFSQELAAATRRMYSWSYALSWLAVGCEIFSACLFGIVGCCFRKRLKPKKLIYSQPSTNTGSRNPAYDSVEENRVIVTPPQVFVVNNDDYYLGGQRTHYDPYSTGDYRSSYSPRYNYERGWQTDR